MAGRDMIAIATGAGKTATLALPLAVMSSPTTKTSRVLALSPAALSG